MNSLKQKLMAGVTAGMMLLSSPVLAEGSTGNWTSVALSSLGTVVSAITTFFMKGTTVVMLAVNVDAPQLVMEYLVYDQVVDIKDKWDPEPADTYQKAAESNGGGGSSGGGGGTDGPSVTLASTQKLPFVTASLINVGIEAIGVGRGLSEIDSDETRTKILGELAYFQEKKSAKSSSGDEEETGAGSCSAPYTICLKELTDTEENKIAKTQQINIQNFATAGIAHAELGLKAVQQAIVNGGSGSQGADLVQGKTTSVQDLSGLIGSGVNTVAAQKIVALMNLELAQRLNQGNALQGSILVIEAARALPKTSEMTD